VVAQEVKNLANQTAKATEEITSQVGDMQSVTVDTVNAIKSIGDTIRHLNQISKSVADAMQQQMNATNEIAKGVEQTAAGTRVVSTNILGVTQAAARTGETAQKVLSSGDDLSKQGETMKIEVESFINNVRSI
jgi:methyl-accepting chemotaxis protein